MKPNPAASRLGTWEPISTAGDKAQAFVPPPLPPDPPVKMDHICHLLDQANLALGRLDGISSILPDRNLFIYMYTQKEALLSTQIEGTQATLTDLLLFGNDDAATDDVQEVSNYIAAMEYALKSNRDSLPISSRLIRETHKILLAGDRGSTKQPGEFRRSQNWIGGSRPANAAFVPPPPERVPELMSDLEKFIHADTPDIPALIKIGLVHVQFETIHPFLDGNGRLGRLLIPVLLCAWEILKEPLLYISLHLKTHRRHYFDLLQRVREQGDWEAWLEFFLESVAETSSQAVDTAHKLISLFATDRHRIEQLDQSAASALQVHQLLQQAPAIAIPRAARRLKLSQPTVAKSLLHLQTLGIVHEITGKKRDRVFAYKEYLDILQQGTEPLSE